MKRYALTVRGKSSSWSFPVHGSSTDVEDWRADGLEVDEVVNEIPAWVPGGLVPAWTFAEDLLWFRSSAWLIVVAAVCVFEGFAALIYAWQHPDLTQIQVLQAASEWAIPFRWFRG